MLDDASIFRAMRAAAKYGGMICMHAENGGAIDVIVQRALAEGKRSPKYHALTRPTTAEAEATSRAIALAEMAGAPVYIVHLSCNDALEKVREARDRGLAALCGDLSAISLSFAGEYGCAWDLKGRSMFLLRRCARNGIRKNFGRGWRRMTLQVVSTDHCPFCLKEQKELGRDDFTKIPNGGPGIENRMSLVFSAGSMAGDFRRIGLCSWFLLRRRNYLGFIRARGPIAVGSDADIVVFDPNEEMVISASDASYAGGLFDV